MSAIHAFVSRFEEPKEPRLRTRKLEDAPPPKKKQRQPRTRKYLSAIEIATDDANRRAVSGDWDGSKGSTFVGLYAICHRMIYGVTPSELLLQSGFTSAAKLARKALHELFGDDPYEMAQFIRWAWEVEKRKAAWAQAKSIDRKRLSYFYQFSRSLHTDYRIERTKKSR